MQPAVSVHGSDNNAVSLRDGVSSTLLARKDVCEIIESLKTNMSIYLTSGEGSSNPAHSVAIGVQERALGLFVESIITSMELPKGAKARLKFGWGRISPASSYHDSRHKTPTTTDIR